LLSERDSARPHLVIVTPEVVRVEEKEYPPAGLVADPAFLFRCRSPGQEQTGPAGPRRRDKDPALPLAQGRILDQDEAQAAREIGDRLIVVPHEKSDRANGLRHGAFLPSKE